MQKLQAALLKPDARKDVTAEIKKKARESIFARQAADLYGVNVRWGGMACCIFHNDKTPSMKVDNRYHCFGCGADGDVINFTTKLFGVGNKQAAEKLAADFGVGYDNQSKVFPKSVIRKLTPK